MLIEIDDGGIAPPHQQIQDQLRAAIERSELEADATLPTVRQLAADLGVAPNTVARAYSDLQEQGWLVSEGRRGTRVASAPPRPTGRARNNALRESIESVVNTLIARGFSKDEIATELRRFTESAR